VVRMSRDATIRKEPPPVYKNFTKCRLCIVTVLVYIVFRGVHLIFQSSRLLQYQVQIEALKALMYVNPRYFQTQTIKRIKDVLSKQTVHFQTETKSTKMKIRVRSIETQE
jgi:hypothetical protein